MWRTTSWCKILAILIKICFFLMLFGIYDTKEWKPEIYDKGENVTLLQMNGKQNLKITFFGCTSKLYVTNVMAYHPRKNLTEGISVNRNYTGRITVIEMNNGILSILLLKVNFMDSGNYTVSTLDGSVEKGRKSIIVPQDTRTSNLESTKGYVRIPSTSTANQTEGTRTSNLESTKGYVTVPSTSTANQTEILVKLVFAGVGAALTVPFSVAITLLIIWRRGSLQFRLTGQGRRPREEKVICSERDIRMSRISCDTAHRGDVDEREYEGLHSNSIDLSVYLEPTGIEPEQIEYHNPGNSYETLRPCENQGKNMYSSLTPEHTTET